jgi:hypothetical protein
LLKQTSTPRLQRSAGSGDALHRSFDPIALGQLECDAWVAYYRRDWLAFARSAITLSRHIFALSWPATIYCSWLVLHATRKWAPNPDNDPAAARRAMERFYRIVQRRHGEPFDPATAAALEVHWWRVHRENEQLGAGGDENVLADALAQLYSHTYGVPPTLVLRAARQRAHAMGHSDQWIREGCHLDSPLIERERVALICSYAALLEAVHLAPEFPVAPGASLTPQRGTAASGPFAVGAAS